MTLTKEQRQEIYEKVFADVKKKWFDNSKLWHTVDGVSYIVNFTITETMYHVLNKVKTAHNREVNDAYERGRKDRKFWKKILPI